MMSRAELLQNLIGIHAIWLVAIAALLQIIFVYFIVRFIVENPRLTPVPPLGGFSKAGHWICRFIAALAWIGVMNGAAMSLIGVLYLNEASRVLFGTALNDAGVLVSRLSGAVVFFHVAGVYWRFVLLDERERERGGSGV